MNCATAEEILNELNESSLDSILHDMLEAALRYVGLRGRWYLATSEGRLEIDSERTRAHNAFIDACNIMSRNQRKNGEDNTWRAKLSDDRKVVGDFACYLVAIIGVRAR